MVERTIASGICLASDGHGCESVLTNATRPRNNAQAVKNKIEPMISVRTIAPTRLLCSGVSCGPLGRAFSARPIIPRGGTRIERSARVTAGPTPDSASNIPSDCTAPDDAANSYLNFSAHVDSGCQ